MKTRFLFPPRSFVVILALWLLAVLAPATRAQNGPACDTYTTKTTADGLGNNLVVGVYAVGSTAYAATAGGLSISTDGGNSFANKTTPNGLGDNRVNGVYALGSTVYAATAGGLSISTDGGNSFSNKTTANGLGNNIVYGVYTVGSTVYAATAGGLSISTDGGNSFTNKTIADGLGDNTVQGVYAVGSTVYAATAGGLSISTDGGNSFSNNTTINGLGSNVVYGVYAVGSTIYVATLGGLGISTDGGSTFTNKTTANGLGDSFVLGVYALGNTVYAATRGGLGISTNGGNSFTNYTTANGLGRNALFGVYALGSTVYAATFGGGLSFCSPTPTITAGPATGTANACVGTASSSQSFSLSASNLTANLLATAPSGFELSTSPSTGFGPTLTLSPSAGVVPPTTLYVRTTPAATAGPKSGSVVLSSTGAVSQSVAVSATVTALPTASLSASPATTLTCTQTSLTLTAGGANTYRFSGPGLLAQSGNQAIVNASGTYSVTVTNTASGCFSTTSITISQDNTAPVASLVSSGTLTCGVTSVTLTASPTGQSYRFSAGATQIGASNQATVSSPGLYSVTVTNPGNGCAGTASATVSQNTTLSPPVLNPSATTTTNQPIAVTATGCAGGTINWLPQGGNGTATGAIYTFAQPGNFTLSATCSIGACTSPAATPLSLQIRPGGFAFTGVTMVSCTLFDEAKQGYQVQFTPQYTGQNGNPISFSVVNELTATTAPPPYALKLYTDNPTITLVATQAGDPTARFQFEWWAACQAGTTPNRPPTTSGIPDQSLTRNQPYQLQLTSYFSDPDGQALTFSATGLPPGLSLTGSLISGTPSVTGLSPVSITALDPGGLSTSASFQLRVNPAPSQPGGFTIVGVTTVLPCEVLSAGLRRVTFNPRYAGLDGSPVSFSVVNEMIPTMAPGPYQLNLYTDNPVITLSARQGDVVAQYVYPWLAGCGSARLGATEPGAGLRVTVLGNPAPVSSVTVEVRGAEGQALLLSLVDQQGRLISEQSVERAGGPERQTLSLGQAPAGVLLLRVSTASQSQTLKVIRTH